MFLPSLKFQKNRLNPCFRLSLMTQCFRSNQQNLTNQKFLTNRLNPCFRLSLMNQCFRLSLRFRLSLKFLMNQHFHLSQMSLG